MTFTEADYQRHLDQFSSATTVRERIRSAAWIEAYLAVQIWRIWVPAKREG